MSKEEQKEMAFQAKLLIDNPAFEQAFETVKAVYLDKLINTKVTDTGERDYYHICVNALDDVKNVLTLHIQNGKVNDKELRKKAKQYR